MASPAKSRILVVDDEEAILETMTYTFEEDYEVHTSPDAARALQILEAEGPFAVVISDQRMPDMSGVAFLERVFELHPATIRIILTGFADMDAIVKAINLGHVYAYIAKPWEPAQLKQLVQHAAEHYELAERNARLLTALRRTNRFLEAVMDRLDVAALAVDAAGSVRQANRLARDYLGLGRDPHGRPLAQILEERGLGDLGAAALRLAADPERRTEELDVHVAGCPLRLRVSVQTLDDPEDGELGRVLLMREISHEPARRRVDELVAEISSEDGPLRERIGKTVAELRSFAEAGGESRVASPGMADLAERTSRTLTALESWLAVDDALALEDYPDAQLLLDRMRIAAARWPLPDRIPARVAQLARSVEVYYESGENRKERIL